MTRQLCIAIHDVAPATWPRCERLLRRLDRVGAPPVTLLVVPDYHHGGGIDRDCGFLRAIDQRRARGDEVALHGYFHVDDAASPRTPLDWARRRLLTDREGEFAALSEGEAGARIARGAELFRRLGWDLHGFVAPAWLLGRGARAALARTSLSYTSTHTHLEPTGAGPRIAAPCLTASARSGWRRQMSRRWLQIGVATTRQQPTVRAALHPADADYPDLVECWEETLRALLSTRSPVTKHTAFSDATRDLRDAR